jgi:hypothetical protein
MTRIGTLCVVAFTGLLAAAPAVAQTEQTCEAAVEQAQRDAANDPALAANDERGNELSTMLAEASEAGLQGNAERCLELVRDARGAAGLEN